MIKLKRICIICSKQFTKGYNTSLKEWKNRRKTCSVKCANESKKGRSSWNKGTIGIVKPNSGSFKRGHHYSPATEFKKGQTREKSKSWKGGKYISQGYAYILNRNHPRSGHNGYVREHIFTVETYLGRPMTSKEVIHHIDGNKTNNHINNLYLFPTQSEHISYHGYKRWRGIDTIHKSNLPKIRLQLRRS